MPCVSVCITVNISLQLDGYTLTLASLAEKSGYSFGRASLTTAPGLPLPLPFSRDKGEAGRRLQAFYRRCSSSTYRGSREAPVAAGWQTTSPASHTSASRRRRLTTNLRVHLETPSGGARIELFQHIKEMNLITETWKRDKTPGNFSHAICHNFHNMMIVHNLLFDLTYTSILFFALL